MRKWCLKFSRLNKPKLNLEPCDLFVPQNQLCIKKNKISVGCSCERKKGIAYSIQKKSSITVSNSRQIVWNMVRRKDGCILKYKFIIKYFTCIVSLFYSDTWCKSNFFNGPIKVSQIEPKYRNFLYIQIIINTIFK